MKERPSKKVSWRERLRYRFDNFMARGGRSIFVSLTMIFTAILMVVIIVRAIILTIAPGTAEQGDGIIRNLYITFLEMTDPGSMALDLSSSGWVKFTSIIAGLAGVVMLSALIAFITTALDQRLARLRKGHSRIVESGHTLILGWSDQDVVEILRELVVANESEHDAVVVVLADRDKEYMDDYLAIHVPDRRTTRVVTRSGNPAAPVNLEIVAVSDAKSAIVLSGALDTDPPEEKASADARVIKSLLGVVASRPESTRLNIVAELLNPHLRPMAEEISPGEITTLDGSDILAKMMVQTSRSVGLSVVYNEILSFEGAEMYFFTDDWAERTFGEVGAHLPDGIPMGIRSNGDVVLNPPGDQALQPGDDLLVLADDDSTIELRPEPIAEPQAWSVTDDRVGQITERELIVGWTPKSPTILSEYAEYVIPGSRIDVMLRHDTPELEAEIAAVDRRLPDLDVSVIDADPLLPGTWEQIDATQYNNVMILGQANAEHDTDRIDAETVMILLLLRSLAGIGTPRPDGRATKLITELVESENQALATHAGVHDFVVSSRFISMLLAQISEEQDISRVYGALFAEEGSEIYLKPAGLYLPELPTEVRFIDLMALASQRSEICLGIKVQADEGDADRNFGVTLIPPKDQTFTLGADDLLVVLAEDET